MVIENVTHTKNISNHLEKYNYRLHRNIEYNEYYVQEDFDISK